MTKGEQVEALFARGASTSASIAWCRSIRTSPRGWSCGEWLSIVVPATTPLASRAEISIAELGDQPFVLFPKVARPNFNDFVTSLCQRHGFVPHIAQEVGDAATGVALVASGFGVCIIPELVKYFRAYGAVYVPMKESPPECLT